MKRIIALLFGPVVAVLSFIVVSSAGFLASLFGNGEERLHKAGCVWGSIVLGISSVKVKVLGTENIPANTGVVFLSNHASMLDIPILYKALPVSFRFLVKKELFKIPFFGFMMLKAGYIPVDRSGGRAALKSIIKAAKKVDKGASVVVFPEGTRSKDGTLGPFKTGGIMVALKTRSPVVPVAIKGSHLCLPKGSLRLRPGVVKVIIGAPLPTKKNGKPLAKDEMTENAWQAVKKLLEQNS